MNKSAIILLLFCLSFVGIHAQNAFLEKTFPDLRTEDAVATDQGYFVISHTDREFRIGNEIDHGYTPILTKLDGDMRVVWEYKFREGRFHALKKIVAVEDGLLLLGTDHMGKYEKNGATWLVKMSLDGDLLWQKHFPYANYNSSEGIWVQPLANGDLLTMTRVFRNYNSLGNLRLLRLSATGDIIWSEMVGMDKYYVGLPCVQLNADGSVLMAGFTYSTRAQWDKNSYGAWVYHIHPDRPKQVLFDREFNDLPRIYPRNALQLDDGGWWIVGHYRGPDNGQKAGVILEISPTGNLRDKHTFQAENGLYPIDLMYDYTRDRIIVAGWTCTPRSRTDYKTFIFEANRNFDMTESQTGEEGRYLRMIPFSSGEFLVVSTNGVHLMR